MNAFLFHCLCFLTADSSEEIPLNPSDYRERELRVLPRRSNGLNSENILNDDDESQEHLFGTTVPIVEQTLNDMQHQLRKIQREANSEGEPTPPISRCERDIAAMSIASMYEHENKEMDSDK